MRLLPHVSRMNYYLVHGLVGDRTLVNSFKNVSLYACDQTRIGLKTIATMQIVTAICAWITQ
jgi:hypothetical protein